MVVQQVAQLRLQRLLTTDTGAQGGDEGIGLVQRDLERAPLRPRQRMCIVLMRRTKTTFRTEHVKHTIL
ncbi:hypothetical protein D9M68_714340 [compost metagenome]